MIGSDECMMLCTQQMFTEKLTSTCTPPNTHTHTHTHTQKQQQQKNTTTTKHKGKNMSKICSEIWKEAPFDFNTKNAHFCALKQ